MKRFAALYDIHGNLPALEAVLDDARRARVDHVVVGGDVVPGPMPAEVIRCLLNLDIPVQFIQGNGEVAVLAQMSGRDPAVPAHFREVVRWVAQQLHSEEQGLLGSWPKTLSFHLPPLGEVLFCHATPRNEYEIFTGLTPTERLLPIFEGLNASVVVCGHTHIQFDRTVGKVRVVNAGSVGMPFGEPVLTGLYLARTSSSAGPLMILRKPPHWLNPPITRKRTILPQIIFCSPTRKKKCFRLLVGRN